MQITLTPVVESLRAIYDVEGVMPRFEAYRALMLGRVCGEFLPLGVFSPMGKRQAGFLDVLLDIGAEAIATEAANKVAKRLSSLPYRFRLILVVADVAGNGWTQRYLTDFEWRFQDKYNEVPKDRPVEGFDRWVTVQLWTDEMLNPEYIIRETQAAIFRAAHLSRWGKPASLKDMMQQEGRSMAFAGCTPDLSVDQIERARATLAALYDRTDLPSCIAALYGDAVAESAGYRSLGVADRAGIDVALSEALESPEQERYLLD